MIVSGGREFHQNLPHHPYPGLLDIPQGHSVEVPDNLTAQPLELEEPHMFCGDEFFHGLKPFSVQFIHTAGDGLIRAHSVDTAHKDISELGGHGDPDQHVCVDVETGIALYACQVQGDYRNLLHAGLFQGPPDKSHIVGGPAAAPGLGHDDGGFVQVIPA